MSIKTEDKMQSSETGICRACRGEGSVKRPDGTKMTCIKCRGTGKSGQYQTKG